MHAGNFRDDLYYRLNVLTISIPPLRDRLDDIPLLVTHFINQEGVQFDRAVNDIPLPEMKSLMSYDWPGNVRELRNCVRRYVLGQEFDLRKFDNHEETAELNGQPLSIQLAALEKKILQETLEKHGGRLKLTYEELGVSRKTLYDKMKKYRLGNPGEESEGV